MPKIRLATSADTERIAEIHVAGWQTAYRGIVPDMLIDTLDLNERRAQWDQRIRDNDGNLLISTVDNEITGFCHLIPSRDNDAGGVQEIAAIYIAPNAWRTGCGKALSEQALAIAREHGAREVTLWVLTQNSVGRRFYEAIGFLPDGATKSERRPGFTLEEVRYRIAC